MRRSGSIIHNALGRASGKLKVLGSGDNGNKDGPSSLLFNKLKNGISGSSNNSGSKRNIGYSNRTNDEIDSPPNAATEAILTRVRKDNARLLRELEEVEAILIQSDSLAAQNAALRKDIADLGQHVVSAAQHNAVVKALRKEKACVAVLQMEKDALEEEVAKKQKKGKRRR